MLDTCIINRQEKNFGESEGELSFVNLPKRLVFNDALTHDVKGYVIDKNVHAFGRKCPLWLLSYHEDQDNWLEGSNFASASARGWRYFKIHIFAPEFLHSRLDSCMCKILI